MRTPQPLLLDEVLEVGHLVHVGDLHDLDAAVLLDVDVAQRRVDAGLGRVVGAALAALHLLRLPLRHRTRYVLVLQTLQELHDEAPI